MKQLEKGHWEHPKGLFPMNIEIILSKFPNPTH